MISLEDFKKYLNFIDERSKKTEEINKLFTEEFEDSIFYPYMKYEAMLVDLLKKVFNDDSKDSWIDYFIYELDMGRNYEEGFVSYEDGTPIPLGTIEDLYKLLIEEMKESKD